MWPWCYCRGQGRSCLNLNPHIWALLAVMVPVLLNKLQLDEWNKCISELLWIIKGSTALHWTNSIPAQGEVPSAVSRVSTAILHSEMLEEIKLTEKSIRFLPLNHRLQRWEVTPSVMVLIGTGRGCINILQVSFISSEINLTRDFMEMRQFRTYKILFFLYDM